jgi:hypothetical protein
MTTRQARRGPSKPSASRIVHYGFALPPESDDECSESTLEALLARARHQGVITQFDTGRGRIVWFEGPPGAAMRKLRAQVRELLPAAFVRV